MLLHEILDVKYLPVKWTAATTGLFEYANKLFAIFIEGFNITTPIQTLTVANISFGVVVDTNKSITSSNISRELTGFGAPRTIIATVGRGCVDNSHLCTYDILLVAASDQVKQKRIGIYVLAINELMSHLPEYKFSYRAHTPNGSILVVISKKELLQDETDFIGREILGKVD